MQDQIASREYFEQQTTVTVFALPIAVIQLADGTRQRAIKAEGMTVDELKRIPGFIPA